MGLLDDLGQIIHEAVEDNPLHAMDEICQGKSIPISKYQPQPKSSFFKSMTQGFMQGRAMQQQIREGRNPVDDMRRAMILQAGAYQQPGYGGYGGYPMQYAMDDGPEFG